MSESPQETAVTISKIEFAVVKGKDLRGAVEQAVTHARTFCGPDTRVFLADGDVNIQIFPEKGSQVAYDALIYAQNANRRARSPQHDYEQ